jgi:putative tryptophan/tyrosine transport system substrate-binding protein
MRRREFVALMGASVAWPFAAMAQEPGRNYRIGCLLSSPRENYVAFFDELRRLGFVEGQNLTVEWRRYAQHVDLLSQYGAELVNARVDVIATAGEEAVRVVQQATKGIPISIRSSSHCKKRRAQATSSFQFIVSPEVRRSLQPSTARRHRTRQH